jgi:acetyl/propionyl-CoA carboxylase alpha subunit
MIGKIISHDLVREDAISKLINFLEKIVIKGIKTNIPFLMSLLKDKNFVNGTHNTKYIENNLNTLISKINSDNNLSEVDIDTKRIKIVETDKLKIVNNRSKTETGGIKVVYFD